MARTRTRGVLILADGTEFNGVSIGAAGVSAGEVVFNTSMTGYQEIITDPSYARQIVTLTSPHVGNYGITSTDDQAATPHCSGLVTRSVTDRPSNWRSSGSLPEWLSTKGIVAVSEIDTRRLTRHIRMYGAMPGVIASSGTTRELVELAATAPGIEGIDLASTVSTRETHLVPPHGPRRGTVVAIDLGIKRRIVDELTSRGLATHVVPSSTSAAEILALDPDGVFVSNGPGDPEPLTGVAATLRELLGHKPIFGICLGHQVLGLALGARTFKLPFGHHGGNHPVRTLKDGSIQITAQNHGFAVDLGDTVFASDFGPVNVTHMNLNDNTVEGLACREAEAFSVQYHPEAAPGPNDARHLFDEFAATLSREAS